MSIGFVIEARPSSTDTAGNVLLFVFIVLLPAVPNHGKVQRYPFTHETKPPEDKDHASDSMQ